MCTFHRMCIFTCKKLTRAPHEGSEGPSYGAKNVLVIPLPTFLNSKPRAKHVMLFNNLSCAQGGRGFISETTGLEIQRSHYSLGSASDLPCDTSPLWACFLICKTRAQGFPQGLLTSKMFSLASDSGQNNDSQCHTTGTRNGGLWAQNAN